MAFAWLLVSALAPFNAAPDMDLARAITLATQGGHGQPSALWAAFWLGLFAHRWRLLTVAETRPGAWLPESTRLFGILALAVLTLAIAQAYLPPAHGRPFAWPAHLTGIVLGMAAAWPLARLRMGDPDDRLGTALWRAGYTTCALLALLTMAPATSPTGWLQEFSALLYRGIRTAMPWVPFGALLGLIGLAGAARIWTLVGLAMSPLVAPGVLRHFDSHDWLGWLIIAPAMALGLWLGTSTRAAPAWRDAASAAAESSARPVTAGGTGDHPVPSRFALLVGAGLLALAAVAMLDFPRYAGALAAALAAYAALLWWRPSAWLLVLPAAWPLLDLAPWTGRFFLDEFDLLMLVTAAMLLWRPQPRRRPPPSAGFLLLAAAFVALTAVAMVRGVWPLAPLDANAFASYWSPYNALRVAKGVLWGALIFWWLRACALPSRELGRRLAAGMALGLLGVGVVGAWEHHLFVGFAERLETYRIVSLFSSMHTGGGHIEAYLVAAVPFLWLATTRPRDLAWTGPVMVLTAYVMLYTVSRGGVFALGVVVLLLLLASGRMALISGGRKLLAPLAMLLAVGLLLTAGAGSGYLMQRFAATGEDWNIRTDHWRLALDLRDGDAATAWFGAGLGSFPRYYLERGPRERQSATFGFAVEDGNTHFRLGHGDTVYFAQRVPFVAGHTYRIEFEARAAREHTAVHVPVCEKQMLNSRQCAWRGFDIPADGAWHAIEHEFSHAQVGAASWLKRPPIELFLYNPGEGGVVDIDNLRLLDERENNLLCNGGFERGADCWFFKTHSHLPWHIKNLWVHLLFEHGGLGLLTFAALTIVAVTRLARAGWQGHRLAWAWLASLLGMLTVGLFDSLLDAPRLAAWLVALLLLGAGWHWRDTGREVVPSARRKPGGRPSA